MLIRNALLLLLLCSSYAFSYKILILCSTSTRSHYNLCSEITNILTERNHEVTFITGFAANKQIKYREILVDIDDIMDSMPSAFKMANMTMKESFNIMNELPVKMSNAIMHSPIVQKMINDKNEKFDLVVMEYLMNQNLLGFSVKYDCPAVVLSSFSMLPWLTSSTGNPFSLATVPNPMGFNPLVMDLWQRVVNVLNHVAMEAIECFITSPVLKPLYEKDFPEESKRIPFDELKHKISAVLSNTHHSISPARPTLPNVVEVAGYHIEQPFTLPDDLKSIMDSAKDGVIYFSLGSVVKTQDMTQEFKQFVIKSLSKFKQTILWKLDEDISDLPKNIIIRKWLPQTSILAHPNIKLFITHGGLLSCTEATHFGVPMLLIPIFGDQHHNALVFTDRGQGRTLNFNNITEETLTWSVDELINNPKYKEISMKTYRIYHDRPVKSRALVAFQIEHVIRTGGGSHMSPPYLPKYSHLLLDVIAILSIPILGLCLLLRCACKKICKKICSKICFRCCNTEKKIKTN